MSLALWLLVDFHNWVHPKQPYDRTEYMYLANQSVEVCWYVVDFLISQWPRLSSGTYYVVLGSCLSMQNQTKQLIKNLWGICTSLTSTRKNGGKTFQA